MLGVACRQGPRGGGREQDPSRVHVALVGFMGAGKTSVGRALSALLGADFVDLDDVIVAEAGRSITAIFRESGEVAFRARERAALRKVLAAKEPLVLATGGGTFVDPSMRTLLQEAAHTVYLEASPEVLAERILHGDARASRPLLAGPDPMATIVRLLQERSSAYRQCDVTVSTASRSVEQLASDIAGTLRLEARRSRAAAVARADAALQAEGAARPQPAAAPASEPPEEPESEPGAPLLVVRTSTGSYSVQLQREAGPWLAEAVCEVCPGPRIGVISDTNVAPLHAAPLISDLRAAGKSVTMHTFMAGEDSKCLNTVATLYDRLLGASLSRGDALVALGGGVTGDLTGFVASTFLRGIAYVQMPTTTLAAVDSSVGGKTGVNTPRGKNLVGTFYPPRAVLVAASHLATQDRREHAAGLVEALKMAATMDAALFDHIAATAATLLDFDADVLLHTLSRSVRLKAQIVARDEHEAGDRAVLNFGHTIGHAIESGEQYRLLHGEAVALGMVAESEWAETEAGIHARVRHRLEAGLRALEVPTGWRAMHMDVDALALDKKRLGTEVRVPVVPEIGTYQFRSVPVSALVEFVSRRKA